MLLVQTLNSVNFQHLTIFICHLLIGGHFQTVQIFYDSRTIRNDQLIRDLNSHCLSEIPWMTFDRSDLEISPIWNNTIKPDHNIQLILTEGDAVQGDDDKLSGLPSNYYRLFVFHSNENKLLASRKSNKITLDSDSNTIGIFHDYSVGEIQAYLLHDDLTRFHKAIDSKDLNESKTSAHVFETVFGEREKMRKLGVFDPNFYCTILLSKPSFEQLYTQFLIQYLFTQMKMDFVQSGNLHCPFENGQYYRPSSQRIRLYDDINWNIERINNNNETIK